MCKVDISIQQNRKSWNRLHIYGQPIFHNSAKVTADELNLSSTGKECKDFLTILDTQLPSELAISFLGISWEKWKYDYEYLYTNIQCSFLLTSKKKKNCSAHS